MPANRKTGLDAPQITDKMPTNFRNLGLIALLSPTRGLSTSGAIPWTSACPDYFQTFHGTGNAFVYDLEWQARTTQGNTCG